MDKIALQQGFQRVMYAIVCSFIGPVIVMQAFKNEGHPMYWPVLIVGLILLTLAIVFGFKGLASLVDGLLDDNKKKQD